MSCSRGSGATSEVVSVNRDKGRDSVLAMNARNLEDTANAVIVVPDARDAELIQRLEKQFLKAEFQPELVDLRLAFQERDKAKGGQLIKHMVIEICSESQLTIYGALLNSLLRRCDDEKNGKISWPEMMSFLDKAWQNLLQSHGDVLRLRPRRQPPSRPASAMRPPTERPSSAAPASGGADNNSVTSSPKSSRMKMQSILQKKVSLASLSSNKGSTDHSGGADARSNGQVVGNNTRSTSNNSTSSAVSSSKIIPDIDSEPANPTSPNPSDEANSQDKKKAPLKKTSSSSGFLNSVRSFLSGNKKEDDRTPPIPLIQVDRHSDIKEETAAELASQAALKSRSKEKFIRTRIRNKELKLWFPDDFHPGDVKSDPPTERIQLDWVYGYRGHDCRSNIYIMTSGEVIYYIANITVLYDVEKHTQRHYKEHTEEIKSMAVHADGVTVATGQSASSQKHMKDGGAHVRIWRSDSLQTLKVLGNGYFEKSIVSLAFPIPKAEEESVRFSPSVEDRLVVIDKSKDHLMSVWNISKGLELARIKIQSDVTCDVDFNPKNPDVIVTIGKEHLMWWRFNAERSLIEVHSRPDYQTHLRAMYLTCLIHNSRGDVITGDSNGTIYIWGYPGNKIVNMVKHAHDGPVFSLHLYRNALISGGRDHMIKSWLCEKYMDSIGSLEIPPTEGGIRIIQLHRGHLLIGTTTNTVLQVVINKNGAPLEGAIFERPMTECHFDDVRGLMALGNIDKPTHILTAGYDGVICLFDAEQRRSLWKAVLKGTSAVCADVSPDGTLLAIGTRDCALLLLRIDELPISGAQDEKPGGDNHPAPVSRREVKEICRVKLGNQKPSVVKISPDQQLIGVGSYDNNIYIIGKKDNCPGDQTPEENTDEEWDVIAKCKGHESFINGIDWSKNRIKDSFLMRTSDYGLDAFVWDTKTFERQNNPEVTRMVKWSSNHCRSTYSTSGVWSSRLGKESELTAICVSPDGNLVAVGDSRGYIGLLRHPCSCDSPYSHVYKGPVFVQDIRFTHNSKYIVTTGGRDTCVMQWKMAVLGFGTWYFCSAYSITKVALRNRSNKRYQAKISFPKFMNVWGFI